MIGHPDIHRGTPVLTSLDDYNGELTDGIHFVFRYRQGYAHLGLGLALFDAGEDCRTRPEWGIGGPTETRFASPQERDLVFAGMLRARRAAADYPRPPQRYVPPDPSGYSTGGWITANPATNARISARPADPGAQAWPAGWNLLGYTDGNGRLSYHRTEQIAHGNNVFNVPAESMVIREADGSVRFRPRDPGNEPPLHRPGRPDTCECRSCVAVRARMAALGDNRAGRRHPGDRR